MAAFRRNMGDVTALEKNGFKVSVRVCRLPDNVGNELRAAYEKSPSSQRHLFKSLVKEKSVSMYMLRDLHEADIDVRLERLASNGTSPSEATHQRNRELLLRENYVCPHGGYTSVEVTAPDGRRFIGESHCHIQDTFNRKIAHARAFGSVFNQMFADAGLSADSGKGPGKAVLSAQR